MKNFCYNTICNITQEPQELTEIHVHVDSSASLLFKKYHQLLSKVKSINGKSFFDQLATASFSTSPTQEFEIRDLIWLDHLLVQFLCTCPTGMN